jgi:hypothetical protein
MTALRHPALAPRVNGAWLDERDRARLDTAYGVRVFDGDFWYDPASGAWGPAGGPIAGFAPSGLPLGAPPAMPSGTGVFVNGRELHPEDLASLHELVTLPEGRYRLDRFGTLALERGRPLVNLQTIARKRGRGGAWSGCGRANERAADILMR